MDVGGLCRCLFRAILSYPLDIISVCIESAGTQPDIPFSTLHASQVGLALRVRGAQRAHGIPFAISESDEEQASEAKGDEGDSESCATFVLDRRCGQGHWFAGPAVPDVARDGRRTLYAALAA